MTMKDVQIAEYGYFAADETYSWVMGPLHFRNRYIGAIRYTVGDRRVNSVKKYGWMLNDPATLAVYGDKLQWVPFYARMMGVFREGNLTEYYCPFRGYKAILDHRDEHRSYTHVITFLENEVGLDRSVLGLGGSRLLHLDTEQSDFDINIYSSEESKKALTALKGDGEGVRAAYISSVLGRSFMSTLKSISSEKMAGRRVFSASCKGGKIDFHCCSEASSIQYVREVDFGEVGSTCVVELSIEGTDRGMFFPGIVHGRTGTKQRMAVLFTDKRFMCLRPGDKVATRGRFVCYQHDRPLEFRGEVLREYFAASELLCVS